MKNYAYLCALIWMHMNFWQVLMYTIPALVVLISVWIVMNKVFKDEEQKRLWELKKASQKEISPTRLRAYERLALVLERTQPEALVMGLNERLEAAGESLANLSVTKMQQELLRTVRLEFDHNLSQQVYVSDETWSQIIGARDEMAAFISTMAIQMPKESTSMDYAKVLMTAYRNNGETPHQIALDALKEEARGLL